MPHTHWIHPDCMYQPLFPVQSTWAPPYLNCSFIACSVQGVSEYSLLKLVPNCRHEWDSGGLRMWQMSPLRILTPGQTHYVYIKLVAHTHAHTHAYTYLHTCTLHTHFVLTTKRGGGGGKLAVWPTGSRRTNTHTWLQVPPLLIQDKDHSTCHTKEENSAIPWITTQAWSKQTDRWMDFLAWFNEEENIAEDFHGKKLLQI